MLYIIGKLGSQPMDLSIVNPVFPQVTEGLKYVPRGPSSSNEFAGTYTLEPDHSSINGNLQGRAVSEEDRLCRYLSGEA
jgi:hypothetical protein